jgi:hypothetical protein
MENSRQVKEPLEGNLENDKNIQNCVLDITKTTRYLLIAGFVFVTLFLIFGVYVLVKLSTSLTFTEKQSTNIVVATVFVGLVCIYVYPLIHLRKRSNQLKRIISDNISISYEDISMCSENVFKLMYAVILFGIFIFAYGLYFELPLI